VHSKQTSRNGSGGRYRQYGYLGLSEVNHVHVENLLDNVGNFCLHPHPEESTQVLITALV
jgi:hypothetical protein